jgi:hypothetical protein
MSIATLVRQDNAQMFAPEWDGLCAPELLAFEPTPQDTYQTPDGRQWVRVYIDGSALDQHGNVHQHAQLMARSLAHRHGEWQVAA